MSSRVRPLILAYNAWGKLAFNVSTRALIQSPAINALSRSGALRFCPVINFSKSDIQTRAQRFSTKLKAMLRDLPEGKVDLVAHSMAGVDLRLALHENPELADRVQNFVSVGSPQRGTLLSVAYANGHLDASQLEKSNLCTGVHYTDLMETDAETMRELHEYISPHEGTQYHAVAGDKAFADQAEHLRRVSRRLLESQANTSSIFNDGLFFDDEVAAGERVLKLNADHLDLSPFGICRGQDAYGHIFKYLDAY